MEERLDKRAIREEMGSKLNRDDFNSREKIGFSSLKIMTSGSTEEVLRVKK